MECEGERDTDSNRGDWNQLKKIQRVPEQHSGEVRNQGITESADVKVQKTFQGRNTITCSTDCKYRTAATLCKI